jgi:hypothetical protein
MGHHILAGLKLVFADGLLTFVFNWERHAVFIVTLVKATWWFTLRQCKLLLCVYQAFLIRLGPDKGVLWAIISEIGEVKVVFKALNWVFYKFKVSLLDEQSSLIDSLLLLCSNKTYLKLQLGSLKD